MGTCSTASTKNTCLIISKPPTFCLSEGDQDASAAKSMQTWWQVRVGQDEPSPMQDIVQFSHLGAFEASAEMKHLNFPKFPKVKNVEFCPWRSGNFILLHPCFFKKLSHFSPLSTPENRQRTLVSHEYSCSHPRQSVMYWHLL